jgi:hypothetical protein
MSRAQLTSTVEQNSAGAAAPWVAGKNALINGGFDWWQRGTSFSGTGYGADRWNNTGIYTNITVSQQSSGAPSGSLYYMRFTSTGAGSYTNMYQYLESATAAMLWGQTVTFSIKMRRNSTLNNTGMQLQVDKSSTTDAGSGATWTNFGTTNVPLASIPTGTGSTNWYTATLTVAIPNDGTAQSLRFYVQYNGTAPSGSVVDIAQAQVEIGSVATPFSRAGGTLQGELALCQRYYYRVFPNASASTLCPSLYCGSSTLAYGTLQFPTQMRIMPTALEQTGTASDYVVYASIGGTTCSAIPTFYDANYNSAIVKFTVASGLNTGYSGYARTGSTAGYLGWSAEL